MPKVPGVKPIPAPNGSVKSGFVRWSDLEEQMLALKQEMMGELQRSLQQYGKKNGAIKGSIESEHNNHANTRAELEDEILRAIKERAQSMEFLTSGSDSKPLKKERVSYNEMREVDENLADNRTTVNQAFLETTDVAADTWGFRGTCWDAAAFVGDANMMIGGESVVVVLLCMICLAVQGLFILIVFLSLSGSPLDQDEIDGFHLWRTNVGQDVNFMNPLTLESLSSRVCRGDSSLHLSDRQVKRIKEIDDYLDNNAPFNGPMMCLLAMLTWTLTVCKEFKVLKDMWTALSSIPASSETSFASVNRRLELRSIHPGRITWIAFLTFFRASIASTLLAAGLLFLAATYSIEDILLNAVALEFVLNVDELLYQALAPVKTKKLLLLVKGISLSRSRRTWRGIDLDVPVTMVFAFGTLGLLFGARLMTEIEKMQDAKDELCAGFKDFQYGASEFSLTMWAKEQSSVEEKMAKFRLTKRYEIIRGAIDKVGDDALWKADPLLEDHLAPSLTGPGWSVVNFGRKSQDFYSADFNDDCSDLFYPGANSLTNPLHGILLDTLRDAAHNETISSCTEVKHYCNTYVSPGPQVRWFCPIMCGCTKPGSSLALNGVPEGCPATCQRRPDMKKQHLDRSCTQPPDDQLILDPIWQQFGIYYATIGASWGDKRELYFGFLAQLFTTRGCDAILSAPPPFVGKHMCDVPPMKTLAFWCPRECGCNTTSPSLECPQSCTLNTPIPIGNQLPSDLESLYVPDPPLYNQPVNINNSPGNFNNAPGTSSTP